MRHRSHSLVLISVRRRPVVRRRRIDQGRRQQRLVAADELGLCRELGRGVEHAARLLVADGAARVCPEALVCAFAAEIMAALCAHGLVERPAAEVACEGEIVVVAPPDRVLVLLSLLVAIVAHLAGHLPLLLTLLGELELLLKLPARLVLPAVVHELAAVAVAAVACVFVILAHVRLVIKSARRPRELRGADRAFCAGKLVGADLGVVDLDVGLVGRGALVEPGIVVCQAVFLHLDLSF
mmetsp:Transcript_31016/g.107237  ORF Transcript_31016/g.107237 Transcript_31016/m.107237 type:complete len:239 (-) Transcript_31016:369-1085(-)